MENELTLLDKSRNSNDRNVRIVGTVEAAKHVYEITEICLLDLILIIWQLYLDEPGRFY